MSVSDQVDAEGGVVHCLNPRQNVMTQTCDDYVKNLKKIAHHVQSMNESVISKRTKDLKPYSSQASSSGATLWKVQLILGSRGNIEVFKKEIPNTKHYKDDLEREIKIFNCIIFKGCSPFFVFPLRITQNYVMTEYGGNFSLARYIESQEKNKQIFLKYKAAASITWRRIPLYLQLHVAISHLKEMNICHGDLHLKNILVSFVPKLYGDQDKWAFDIQNKKLVPPTENALDWDGHVVTDKIIKIFDWDHAKYLPDVPHVGGERSLSLRKKYELADMLSFIRQVARNVDHESVMLAMEELKMHNTHEISVNFLIFHDYQIDIYDEKMVNYEGKCNLSKLDFENKGMRHGRGYFWTDKDDVEYEILSVTDNIVTMYNREVQKKIDWPREDAEKLLQSEIVAGHCYHQTISHEHHTKPFHYHAISAIFEKLYFSLWRCYIKFRARDSVAPRSSDQVVKKVKDASSRGESSAQN